MAVWGGDEGYGFPNLHVQTCRSKGTKCFSHARFGVFCSYGLRTDIKVCEMHRSLPYLADFGKASSACPPSDPSIAERSLTSPYREVLQSKILLVSGSRLVPLEGILHRISAIYCQGRDFPFKKICEYASNKAELPGILGLKEECVS